MYRQAADRCSDAVRKLCWNQKYGLLADTPAQLISAARHILGIWLDVIPQRSKTVLAKFYPEASHASSAIQPAPMSQATYYFASIFRARCSMPAWPGISSLLQHARHVGARTDYLASSGATVRSMLGARIPTTTW